MKAFLDMYTTLRADNLDKLRDVYRHDVQFVDPAHEIHGIDNLTTYFRNLYRNVRSISFSFEEPAITAKGGYVRWRMHLCHDRLAGGRTVEVDGVTFIEMDDEGLVYYHRDFFDMGQMVYENVTILGALIRQIKRRLGQ